jgi:hypothetical protein
MVCIPLKPMLPSVSFETARSPAEAVAANNIKTTHALAKLLISVSSLKWKKSLGKRDAPQMGCMPFVMHASPGGPDRGQTWENPTQERPQNSHRLLRGNRLDSLG